jgi:hypothetical protein
LPPTTDHRPPTLMNTVKKLAFALILLPSLSLAQQIAGTVTNATTNKPSANAEVVLISLAQGMSESARTTSDAQGNFKLKLDDTQAPHLVRVSHQGVNYFKMVPPGTNTAQVQVYDTATKLDGLNGTVNVVRYQSADGKTLQVIELYSIRNSSTPPRTLTGEKTFQLTIPAGAAIDGGSAQSPGGQPINSAPVRLKDNQFAFSFPLKPGETRFQLEYHLPYSGEFSWSPRPSLPMEHFVVVLPQSMSFEAKNAGQFSPMPDETGTNVQVSTALKPGQDASFRIAGTGQIQEEQQADASQGGATGQQQRGPGGGLGTPIGSPDPLTKYRWVVLGVFAIVLTGGAVHIMGKSPRPATPADASVVPPSAVTGTSNRLLDAMKEELFELELERQQGKISEDDYKQAKAALDQTLQRALARSKNS